MKLDKSRKYAYRCKSHFQIRMFCPLVVGNFNHEEPAIVNLVAEITAAQFTHKLTRFYNFWTIEFARLIFPQLIVYLWPVIIEII